MECALIRPFEMASGGNDFHHSHTTSPFGLNRCFLPFPFFPSFSVTRHSWSRQQGEDSLDFFRYDTDARCGCPAFVDVPQEAAGDSTPSFSKRISEIACLHSLREFESVTSRARGKTSPSLGSTVLSSSSKTLRRSAAEEPSFFDPVFSSVVTSRKARSQAKMSRVPCRWRCVGSGLFGFPRSDSPDVIRSRTTARPIPDAAPVTMNAPTCRVSVQAAIFAISPNLLFTHREP